MGQLKSWGKVAGAVLLILAALYALGEFATWALL